MTIKDPPMLAPITAPIKEFIGGCVLSLTGDDEVVDGDDGVVVDDDDNRVDDDDGDGVDDELT